MSKPNEYLDDSLSKKSTRSQMLRRTKQLFAVSGRPPGAAVTLAGPSAGDFSGLKYVLNYRSEEMVFVDRNPVGLYAALERDDRVLVYEGHIDDALNEMLHSRSPASFINLDFCGRFSEEVKASCVLASKVLANRGLMFLTFFRGRERADEKLAMRMPDSAARQSDDRESARCRFIITELRRVMGAEFEQVFLGLYNSHAEGLRHSPMGVVGFQKMPHHLRTSAWREVAKKQATNAVKSRLRTKDDASDALRAQVIALAHEGRKSKEIGAILNVPATRVAAWLANHTRGR